jgi:phosphoribosyl-ATP pyrophosphohydrolase
MSSTDALARLAAVIESRKPANGGDPEKVMWRDCSTKAPMLF